MKDVVEFDYRRRKGRHPIYKAFEKFFPQLDISYSIEDALKIIFKEFIRLKKIEKQMKKKMRSLQ